MRALRLLLAAVATAGAAACSDAPTATLPPTTGAALSLTNQPPVAVITQTAARLYMGGRRYELTAANSYDPDGSIVDYRWTSDCIYNPTTTGSVTYTLDVNTGDTCEVMLIVYDNGGASGVATKTY